MSAPTSYGEIAAGREAACVEAGAPVRAGVRYL